MRYRKLADTDVTLSEVGFGVWTVAAGWWGDFTDDQAADLLRRSLDLGITFFDTGDTYGNGRGETILAKAFGGQRDKIVIGTKFGYDFYTDPDAKRGQRERPHNWTPQFVRFALEQSLKRLDTDYIDLWMLHNPRLDAIQRDDLFALLDDQGKYTPETVFPPSDHRSHRPRSWLIEGLQKIETLKFLHEQRGMTLGQAALKWVLAEPTVTSAQPNIYDVEQLEEFAAAPDLPDLTPDDLRTVADLYARNFDLPEAVATSR